MTGALARRTLVAAFALLAVEFVFRFQRLLTGERGRRMEATSVS